MVRRSRDERLRRRFVYYSKIFRKSQDGSALERAPKYDINELMKESGNTALEAQKICERIKQKVDKDRKEPTGNQNCLLCTWCAEAQLRGLDILPRPVYSPRDVIFGYTNAEIVKNPDKIRFKNQVELVGEVQKGQRFYCHVNWAGSEGGHEFLLLSIDGEVFVMDPQAGLLANIESDEGAYYFKDINFANSFLVRLDNKELNEDALKLNNDEYIREFDEVEDLKYL